MRNNLFSIFDIALWGRPLGWLLCLCGYITLFTFLIRPIWGLYLIVSALLIINLAGALPGTPAFSTHLAVTLVFGFTFWSIVHLDKVMGATLRYFSLFVPTGAPSWLAPFLFHVEVISVMVRPVTLSFRLAANLTRGHVILSLIASMILNTPLAAFYCLFEVAVASLQAYIFYALVTIYLEE